jgi:hypothetical protein
MRATVCLLLVLLLVSGTALASTDGTDALAIASLFSIGSSSAQSDFASLRGALVEQNDHTLTYRAKQKPHGGAYASCFVLSALPAFSLIRAASRDPVAWLYSCNSTRRAMTPDGLFAEIEPLVRANLPVGYSSSATFKTVPNGNAPSKPWEYWKRTGSPMIFLQVTADSGSESHYALGLRRDRTGQ